MSNPLHNDCVKAALTELERAGIRGAASFRAKHVQVTWTDAGGEQFYVVPSSPSDRRAHLNVRTDIRRMIRVASDPANEVTIVAPVALVDGEAVTNSRDVADRFEKRHDNVLREVDNLLKNMDSSILRNAFRLVMRPDGNGIDRRTYDMTRDGFALLAMGFTGAAALRWKIAYIEAFNALERFATRPSNEVEVSRLRGDLDALTDIVLSLPAPAPRPVRKPRFVRPSVLRRMRVERRAS